MIHNIEKFIYCHNSMKNKARVSGVNQFGGME